MQYDLDAAGDLALALMFLTLHEERRAWKGLEWEVLDHLHQQGFISNPQSRAKSVLLSDEGYARATAMFQKYLADPA